MRLIKKIFGRLIIILLTPLILLGVYSLSLLLFLPNIAHLKSHNPTETEFIELYEESHDKQATLIWINYSEISDHLKRAVLAAEDDTFFEHRGFNLKEIKRAFEINLKTRSFKRGASTITQQLVKNLYLGPQKSLHRKLREVVLTVHTETLLSKERILELYLNLVEWGPGIFGAEAASQFYFKKSASRLLPSEAAYLAALLPNPKKLSQPKYSRLAKKRAAIIGRRLNHVLLTKSVAILKTPSGSNQESQEESETDILKDRNLDEANNDSKNWEAPPEW